MKITALYFYPIKALRPIRVDTAILTPEGVLHDRRFMLFKPDPSTGAPGKNIQLSHFPQCGLFEQTLVVLEVPLRPDIADLQPVDATLHSSPAAAYSMGDVYDAWFSACFGFPVLLVYIGDGKRPVLGNLAPATPPQAAGGWYSTLTSSVPGLNRKGDDRPASWLTFTDVAPFLITCDSSLRDVQARMRDEQTGAGVEMYKFRPNIVVSGEEEWAEDFWGELQLARGDRLVLTANCGRCTSLNVDYETGRQAAGELGTVLKKLMNDRRVDKGNKYSPVFGRYGFLDGEGPVHVSVGDEVVVSKRIAERTAIEWPGL
ncbi:hypothetical protein B0H13DRAFT_2243237 [Mycena leptocephala]|nr:hypothetical protein B0H13DRAFT_2243237 [Mycena leptocephala]